MFKRQMEKMQYWRAKWTYSNRYQELLRWYSLFDADGKESACSAGDLGMTPGSGRSPGEGNGYPLQYSCLENSMERGAWWATVQGVTKCQTRLTYRYTDMRDTHTHTVCKQCACCKWNYLFFLWMSNIPDYWGFILYRFLCTSWT